MTEQALDCRPLSDLALAARIAARDRAAVRLVTERNNQRLFRTAWAILKDRTEAEDAVQSAYLHAFAMIDRFEGRSSLATWLTRITINEALQRERSARRRRAHLDADSVVDLNDYREKLMRGSTQGSAPDAELARAQVRTILEGAIGDLPQEFRTVFVFREIEGLSVDETAAALDIPPATVKTRHFRARRRLQEALAPELRNALTGSFPFAGADCLGLTTRILTAWCECA
jgi:RNA polymerase sigma-70 factor (ECF subfamily)